MQEEIGTGGGGFQVYLCGIFAGSTCLYCKTTNCWKFQKYLRRQATFGALQPYMLQGYIKGRLGSQEDFNQMGDYLIEIAELEKNAFLALKNIKWA